MKKEKNYPFVTPPQNDTEKIISLLIRGAESWNKWRNENPDFIPDLRGQMITMPKLFELSKDVSVEEVAQLLSSGFQGINMNKARFKLANLSGNNFAGSSFKGADLTATLLNNVDFRNADLSNAKFYNANLTGADLTGANLNKAIFSNTVLANTNLSDIKFAENTVHEGPSIIDHRTILLSKSLPSDFLKGCGLPNGLIKYYLENIKNLKFHSCFISYSSNDYDFATIIHNRLQENGIRCWFAREDMKIGDKIRQTLENSINDTDKLLIILSMSSISSSWVEKEIETAFEKEKKLGTTVLFPITIDDEIFQTKRAWAADIKRTRHIGSFIEWGNKEEFDKSFNHLLRDLTISQTND